MWPGEPGSVSGTLLPDVVQVLEYNARRAGAHRQPIGGTIEPVAEIDPAAGAERRNRLASLLVERIEPLVRADEDEAAGGDDSAGDPGGSQ